MKQWILCVLLFSFLGNWVLAQTYDKALRLATPGIISGARSLGMGNSYSALSDDINGTLFNPAGLGAMKNDELSLSILSENGANKTTLFDNTLKSTDNQGHFTQIGLAFRIPTKEYGVFVFAVSYNKTKSFNSTSEFKGFNSSNSYINYLASRNDDLAYNLFLSYGLYDDNDEYIKDTTVISGGLDQKGNIKETGDIHSWTFSDGAEVSKNIYVGTSVSFLRGEYKNSRNYYEIDSEDNYDSSVLADPSVPGTSDFQKLFIEDSLEWSLSGWEAKAGVLFVLPYHLQAGITIKSPSFYTITETYYLDAYSEFGSYIYYLDSPEYSEVQYKIRTPFEYTCALAYKTRYFTLSGEMTSIDYSQTKFSESGDGDYSTLSTISIAENNRDIKNNFRSVINYSIGAEYVFSFREFFMPVRGGYMVIPSAYKDDHSDFDKKYITFGIGFVPRHYDKISIDLAYSHGHWNTIGDNYGSGLSRTYQEVSRNNFLLSVKFLGDFHLGRPN